MRLDGELGHLCPARARATNLEGVLSQRGNFSRTKPAASSGIASGGERSEPVTRTLRQTSSPSGIVLLAPEHGVQAAVHSACLALGLDVYFPAGQFGGQANVLATAPDSQAELIIGHNHLRAPASHLGSIIVERYSGDAGWTEGVGDVVDRVRRPADDVDFFVA